MWKIGLVILSLFWCPAVCKAADNLLANPGFENGSDGNWQLINGSFVTAPTYSGSRAIKLANISKVTSKNIAVPSNAIIYGSFWVQLENTTGAELRFLAFNSSGAMVNQTFGATDGSVNSWKKFEALFLTRPEVRTVQLQFKINAGVGYVDEASLQIIQETPVVNTASLHNPILLPKPRWINYSSTKVSLPTQAAVYLPDKFLGVKSSLNQYLAANGITGQYYQANQPSTIENLIIVVGDQTNLALANKLQASFNLASWNWLGSEGYFLATENANAKTTIYLGGLQEAGLFWGLQTLKQATLNRNLYLVEALDWPSYQERGLVVGNSWFSYPTGASRTKTFATLAENKLNFSWVQGTYLGCKFYYNKNQWCSSGDSLAALWRQALTTSDLADLRDYATKAKDNFVKAYFSIAPRGTPRTTFSDLSDIALVVNKFKQMYSQAGVRYFGLSFDDLVQSGDNQLYAQADIQQFGSYASPLGAAHAYFVKQVYQNLIASYPDIELMVVPYGYYYPGSKTETEDDYFKAWKEMAMSPKIWLYTTAYFDQDITSISQLTNSQTGIWSNLYPDGYGDTIPDYLVPYPKDLINTNKAQIEKTIGPYTLLPLTVGVDQTDMAVKTFSQMVWNPQDYNPELAFNQVIGQKNGVTDGTNTTGQFCQMTTDVNCDNNVNFMDLLYLLKNYQAKTEYKADVVVDKIVNGLDWARTAQEQQL